MRHYCIFASIVLVRDQCMSLHVLCKPTQSQLWLVAPAYFQIKYRDTSLTLARTSHCLNLHFCRILFGPPNFFMSLQKSHWAQSSVLLQGSHSPHILTERFTWGQSHNRQWEALHTKRWLYLFSPWKGWVLLWHKELFSFWNNLPSNLLRDSVKVASASIRHMDAEETPYLHVQITARRS